MPKQGEQGGQGKTTGQPPANITQHLRGCSFPCNRGELIKHARQNGADQSVINLLQNMPDRQYVSMADVLKNYEQAREEMAA